jgi:hypothetical protein
MFWFSPDPWPVIANLLRATDGTIPNTRNSSAFSNQVSFTLCLHLLSRDPFSFGKERCHRPCALSRVYRTKSSVANLNVLTGCKSGNIIFIQPGLGGAIAPWTFGRDRFSDTLAVLLMRTRSGPRPQLLRRRSGRRNQTVELGGWL